MTRFAFIVMALLGAVACGRTESGAPTPREKPPVAAPVVAALPPAKPLPSAPRAEPTAPSIYELDVALTDESGATRALADFKGHPVLITMFYATCPAACPLLTSDLKRIERALPEASRSKLRVLMVSFDAARDTPAALARVKKERGMDAKRWTLASAEDDQARELAAVLGIRYRKLDNGEFFHSSVIVLLDAEGRPVVKLDGIGADPAPVLAALSAPST